MTVSSAPSAEPEFVIAFDPGKTTGVCVARVFPDRFEPYRAYEIKWGDRLGQTLDDLKRGAHTPWKAVIIEDFKLYPSKAKAQSRSGMPSSLMIGAIQAFCYVLDLSPPVLQSPSIKARSLILPEHRELLGTSAHVKDAYKHLRYWFMTEYRQ